MTNLERMIPGIPIPLGDAGRGSATNSTAVLVSGISLIAVAIASFAISATNRNTDPTDFFYDFDNETATVFAIFGAVMLIVGIVCIGLSFKLKDDEKTRQESQARAEEAARQQSIQDLAKAIKSNIKIRCRYCGTLNEEAASNCISCGAAL
jgi:rubrerythrin